MNWTVGGSKIHLGTFPTALRDGNLAKDKKKLL